MQGAAPLRYRWLREGLRIHTPAAYAPSLHVPAISMADAGMYQCRVTNADGSTLSNPAVLNVKQPAVQPPQVVVVEEVPAQVQVERSNHSEPESEHEPLDDKQAIELEPEAAAVPGSEVTGHEDDVSEVSALQEEPVPDMPDSIDGMKESRSEENDQELTEEPQAADQDPHEAFPADNAAAYPEASSEEEYVSCLQSRLHATLRTTLPLIKVAGGQG